MDANADRDDTVTPAWQERVVDRSLGRAQRRSLDRGADLIAAAARLLERSNGDDFTVQDVADEAKQSLRSLYVHFQGKDDLLLAVFEEGIQNYARRIRQAIAVDDDPLPRLVAALYFAMRISESGPRGVGVGLARLRAKLLEVAPDQLARAHAPVTQLFDELLSDAAEAGAIDLPKPEAAAYMVLTLRESVSLSHLVGNEYGLDLPTVVDLVEFALRGLNAALPAGWQMPLEERWNTAREKVSLADDLVAARDDTAAT